MSNKVKDMKDNIKKNVERVKLKDNMIDATFGFAIDSCFNGHKAALPHWLTGGAFMCVQEPDENSLMTEPYIVFNLANGKKVPYAPSQIEMAAKHWIIFDDIEEVVETGTGQ